MRNRLGYWRSCVLVFVTLAPFALAGPPSLTTIEPPQGFDDTATVVTATGDGFVPQSRVGLPGGGPFLVGSIDMPEVARSVTVVASYSYIAGGIDGVYVLDLSMPSGPTLLRTVPTKGDAVDLTMRGDLLVVVASVGDAGVLELFDASDPADPVSVGEATVSGTPTAVAAVDRHAYVTILESSEARLLVFEIGDPGTPLLVGSAALAGSANDLAVTRELALVAGGGAGLEILGVEDPSLPEPLGTFPTSQPALGVAVSNELALVAAVDGLSVIEITDPTSPQLVGTATTSGSAVTVEGPHAFVAGDTAFWSVDIGDPASPRVVSRRPLAGAGRAVSATAEVACVAAGDAGAQVFDVRSPASPDPVIGRLERPGSYILVSDGLAAMMDDTQGLVTIDVTNPAAPDPLGYDPSLSIIHDPAGPAGLAGGDRFVYVGRWWEDGCAGSICYPKGGSVRVLDLADPTNPVKTHHFFGFGKMIQGIASSESILVVEYFLPFTELEIFELDDPAQPRKVGTWAPGWAGGLPLGVAASERLALLVVATGANSCRLDIVDTTLTGGPDRVGSVEMTSCPAFFLGGSPLSVRGTQVAVIGLDASGSESWLGIVDFTNPEAPRLVGERWFEGKATAVELRDELAIVATDAGLVSFDLREPSQPVLAGRYDTRSLAERVTIAGEHAYVTGESLSVVRLTPPLEDLQWSSDTQLQWTVPAGFAAGPYDVLVDASDDESACARNGFRICARRELESVLLPVLDLPNRPGGLQVVAPLRWRLALTGDDSLFEPEPIHEAHLLLPELPDDVIVRFLPAPELSIELNLLPEAGLALATVLGPDEETAMAAWEMIRQSGVIELPALDDRRYGDFRAMVTRTDSIGPLMHLATNDWMSVEASGTPRRFHYDLVDGKLAGAGAWGPEVDLYYRASATYDGTCQVQDAVGWVETIALLCEELGSELPNHLFKLCADQGRAPHAPETTRATPSVWRSYPANTQSNELP